VSAGHRTLRAALTGGIATGKSHCLARFAGLGAPTIDADVLAREAVGPGTAALAAIEARFGLAVLETDGTLDRQALGAIVFADDRARHDLEAIVHPEVYARIASWFDDLTSRHVAIGIADIPLIFETRHEADFDAVIVAACEPPQQLERLIARGMSDSEARRRIAAQLPIALKRERADYVIDTGGTIEATDRQVAEVWKALNDSRNR
jgi:dephospho-CoA kinase